MAACLGAAAIWPLVAVSNWLGVNVGTLEQLARSDPGGFRPLPALLLFVRPALAGAAALLAPLAAIRVFRSPPPSTPGILMRAALIQLGLVLTFAAARVPVHAALADWVPMAADRQTPGAYVAPAHYISLQEAAERATLPPLAALALGVGALAITASRLELR
jgi:hypothetical protein